MQGTLSFLLFAGALHINLNDLVEHKGVIATLSLAGVVISLFVFGTLIYLALGWLGFNLDYTWCLLVGADFSHGSGGGGRDSEGSESAAKPGGTNRRGVAVQRRHRGGGVHLHGRDRGGGPHGLEAGSFTTQALPWL